MRRDYFICTFLLCICVSLFYVCFSPLYFVYGHIVERDFGIFETIFAWVYFLFTFGVLPVYAALAKKFWVTAGLASYSFFCACLPAWILPTMESAIGGTESNIIAVTWGFCLKAIYGMAEAPFAPLSQLFGDKFTETLSRKILFVVLFIYCVVQIYRFYRDAYLAEKLNPATALDKTTKEHKERESHTVRHAANEPEVIGTVISAPATPASAPDSAPKPAPVPVPPVKAPTAPAKAPAVPLAPATPVHTSAPATAPVPAAVPSKAPVKAPAKVPVKAPAPAPAPVNAHVKAPTSASVPAPHRPKEAPNR